MIKCAVRHRVLCSPKSATFEHRRKCLSSASSRFWIWIQKFYRDCWLLDGNTLVRFWNESPWSYQ